MCNNMCYMKKKLFESKEISSIYAKTEFNICKYIAYTYSKYVYHNIESQLNKCCVNYSLRTI